MACAVSIIGQCIYYALASTVIRKVFADTLAKDTEDTLELSADSVWYFSLGGIARIKEEYLLSSKAKP